MYVRKGARRSPARMRAIAQYKRERAQEELRSAQHKIERYTEIIGEIARGTDLNNICL